MNVWFGTSWGAPVCEVLAHVPVPIGETCQHCEERIEATESGWGQGPEGPWMHVECFMRMLLGSTGHQLKLCPCYGGTYEGEPDDMSRRDAARAAWDLAQRRNVH